MVSFWFEAHSVLVVASLVIVEFERREVVDIIR